MKRLAITYGITLFSNVGKFSLTKEQYEAQGYRWISFIINFGKRELILDFRLSRSNEDDERVERHLRPDRYD